MTGQYTSWFRLEVAMLSFFRILFPETTLNDVLEAAIVSLGLGAFVCLFWGLLTLATSNDQIVGPLLFCAAAMLGMLTGQTMAMRSSSKELIAMEAEPAIVFAGRWIGEFRKKA